MITRPYGYDSATIDPPLDIRLDDRWRLTNDARQWILERREGHRWHEREFHVERDYLLARIAALAPQCRPEALATIRGWDRYFSMWAARLNAWFDTRSFPPLSRAQKADKGGSEPEGASGVGAMPQARSWREPLGARDDPR